jgi:hypothetical protein
MKPADDLEKTIRNDLNFAARADLHDRILDDVLNAQEKTRRGHSVITWPNLRRQIMKNPIAKLITAAVIIVLAVLGLFEFFDAENKAGVVWAEVAEKVQASRGMIFRSQDSYKDTHDYTMQYLSSTHSRLDSYKANEIVQTIYDDFNTKTVILVDHLPSHKSYVKMTFEQMKQSDFLTNPKSVVKRFLAHEHTKLGQRIVEGVLCEGIETTDPTFDEAPVPTDSVMARIWVSVETGYPVKYEYEIVRNNGEIRLGGVADQFQWDVELDESIFEPNIPPDYIDISP